MRRCRRRLEMLRLPDDWIIAALWNCGDTRAQGILARCIHDARAIEIYPRWWMVAAFLALAGLAVWCVIQHELGHAWGLPGHAGDCIMYEADGVARNTWVEKPRAVVAAIGGLARTGHWFCSGCRKRLREAGAL
jgi:hypothetical protein